jgi:hypothetical protein
MCILVLKKQKSFYQHINKKHMKKCITMLIILSTFSLNGGFKAYGQDHVYTTSGMEMIFSFADITINGENVDSKLRWTPFLNFHTYLHFDLNENIGAFTGLAIRNVGFIYNDPQTNNLNIFRTYNLGIPISLKLGDFEKGFIYGGYEIEFPFHFKHKYWESSDRSGAKTKINAFFSNRTSSIFHTAFAGIQFRGINVKFKYYMNNFFNQKFTEGGVTIYDGYESNIFYISLTASMLRNKKLYYFTE